MLMRKAVVLITDRFRQYGVGAAVAAALRLLRFPLHFLSFRRLLQLSVYQRVIACYPDPFHLMSHRNYLCRGWSMRHRIAAAHAHFAFEQRVHAAVLVCTVWRARGRPLVV